VSIFKKVAFHPFLFSIFPTLVLLGHNIKQVALIVAKRPLIFSVALTMFLYIMMYIFYRKAARAGLATSLALLWFFSYGHIYHTVKSIPVISQVIGHHRYLLVIYVILLIWGLLLIRKTSHDLKPVTQVLNVISLGLLVFPIIQIVEHTYKTTKLEDTGFGFFALEDRLVYPDEEDMPDIYYIILDTYTRADSMQEFYHFDNTPFLSALREIGFYVADCSRCNHCSTIESLSSSLNMDYMPQLREKLLKENKEEYASSLLKNSLVRYQLEQIGYKTVAFETWFVWSTLDDADIFLSIDRDPILLQLINPFEEILMDNSVGLVFADIQKLLFRAYKRSIFEPVDQYQSPFQDYIIRQLYILDNLDRLETIPGPKWIFAHILIPHPPRIFTPDGGIVNDPGYFSLRGGMPINGDYEIKGYVNEVQFINNQILEIVTNIIEQSDPKPFIIIQGDTGGSGQTLFTILNAYYLMGEKNPSLYEHITPVNTFRLIFDSYFGSNYGLLPDLTYREDLVLVPEKYPACIH
jgi:hypothetical protein